MGRRQVQHSTDMLYIEYAVNDALVASHIFLRLVEIKFNPLSQDLDIFFCLWEKKTENTLTPWDPCVEGKTMKLSSSPSIEHQEKSNNSGFPLNLSENLEHFQKSAAFDKEWVDRFTSEISENRSSNQESMILKGKITDKRQNSRIKDL